MCDSETNKINGARALVDMLIAYEVEVIFGVPGDTSLALYDALYTSRSKIRHILVRDERSAAFMADAYARLTGKPGVCECPSGAGALYSIPGIAEANASSIPLILLTSGVALSGEDKGTITELDHHKLFEPVTKWSSFLKFPDKIPETLRRAFRITTTSRPGAVHLCFPTEVMSGRFTPGPDDIYSEPECIRYPAFRTRGDSRQITKLADLLGDAHRPMIIAGGGAVHSNAGDLIIKIAEQLSIPVATTISGQGIMPDHHSLAIGVVGDNGFHPHAHAAVEQADLLVYLGCKMGSVSTIKWTKPAPTTTPCIVQVDIDPVMLANNYKNELSIAGDIRLVLKDLHQILRGKDTHSQKTDWSASLNQIRDRFWEESASELASNDIPIRPQRVINSVNTLLKEPSVVISDAGTPTPYITRFLRLKGKDSRFIIPRSFGGLGYAVPAILGAHLARPDALIIGMFGDGSLGMSAGELETLARLNIPAVLIHLDNGPVFIDIVTQPEFLELPPVYSWTKNE